MWIGACLKFVDRRPEVDAVTGEVRVDPRSSGASEAYAAALEWALRSAGAWGGQVVVVTAAGPEADDMLREALAVGAECAVRVDTGAATSETVARALAGELRDCALV